MKSEIHTFSNNLKLKNSNRTFLFAAMLLLFAASAKSQTETKIPMDSLPATVHNELHKKYAYYAVNSVLKITDEQQKKTYKIEVQKKTTSIELTYDDEGKLIRKEKSKIFSFDGTERMKSKSESSSSNGGSGGHQH